MSGKKVFPNGNIFRKFESTFGTFRLFTTSTKTGDFKLSQYMDDSSYIY